MTLNKLCSFKANWSLTPFSHGSDLDTVAKQEAQRICGERPDLCSAESSLDADALNIVTEWKAFMSPDFDVVKSRLKSANIFDRRNLFDSGIFIRYYNNYVLSNKYQA